MAVSVPSVTAVKNYPVAKYQVAATYAINDLVSYAGVVYVSIAAGNTGNTPSSDDGTHWAPILNGVPSWSSAVTYAASAVVSYLGVLYVCQTSNKNNVPSSDTGTNWVPMLTSVPSWSAVATYPSAAIVAYLGTLYVSTAASNKNNTPSSDDGTYWSPLVARLPLWSAQASYALNDIVNRNGTLYKSTVDSNLNHDPATDTTGAYWIALQIGGGGGSIGINYIANGTFEQSLSGWNLYNDGDSAVPVDGTGGTIPSSGITFTRAAISFPYENQGFMGSYLGRLNINGVTGRGQGVSTDFYIDRAYTYSQLQLQFLYFGSFNIGDFVVYLYDIDSGTLINADAGIIPSNNAATVSEDPSELGKKFICNFQTRGSANGAHYRLIFHVASNSLYNSINLDQISLGPIDNAYQVRHAPINYLGRYEGSCEGLIGSWNTYSDAPDVIPVDGMGVMGSDQVPAFAPGQSLPISGGAAETCVLISGDPEHEMKGGGASFTFEVDRRHAGAVMELAFDYMNGVSAVLGDFRVYLYDIDNATLVTPQMYVIPPANVSVASRLRTRVVLGAGLHYRLLFHIAIDALTRTQSLYVSNLRLSSLHDEELAYGAERNLLVNGSFGVDSMLPAFLYDSGSTSTCVPATSYSSGSPLAALSLVAGFAGPKALRLSRTGAASGYGAAFYFYIDPAMQNGTVLIDFFYKASANYVDGDVAVMITDGTNLILPSVSAVPYGGGGITKFTAAFLPQTLASGLFTLCFHITSSTSAAWTFDIDELRVSASKQMLGASISMEKTYAPALVGLGTPTNVFFTWARRGNKLVADGKFTAGTTTEVEARIPLPNAYVTDSSLISTIQVCGFYGSSATSGSHFMMLMEPGVDYVTFGAGSDTLSSLNKLIGTSLASSGVSISVHFEVPISGWGSNTNLLADFQEFASNSQATINTNDTTSFAYGPNGAPILADTAVTYYDVQFLRSIQPTDDIRLEVRSVIDGAWTSSSIAEIPSLYAMLGRSNLNDTSGYYYPRGMAFARVSSNKVRVYFFAKIAGTATYAEATASSAKTWAQVIAAADGFDRWRVRKISNGNTAEIPQNIPPPIGYVYVQSPFDASPATMWPNGTWTDVSSEEANLTRRAVGNLAGSFFSGTPAVLSVSVTGGVPTITIVSGGRGYVASTIVTLIIAGTCSTQMTAHANTDANGTMISISVDVAGEGYTSGALAVYDGVVGHGDLLHAHGHLLRTWGDNDYDSTGGGYPTAKDSWAAGSAHNLDDRVTYPVTYGSYGNPRYGKETSGAWITVKKWRRTS